MALGMDASQIASEAARRGIYHVGCQRDVCELGAQTRSVEEEENQGQQSGKQERRLRCASC